LSPEICPESVRGTFLVRDSSSVTLLQWTVMFPCNFFNFFNLLTLVLLQGVIQRPLQLEFFNSRLQGRIIHCLYHALVFHKLEKVAGRD